MDRIGRYKVVRELGRGAMGVVYHAIDPNIGRPVAIKTIRLSEVSLPEERARLRERLFREARSAGILSHPGIVTIYDVDQQDDLAFIAMEFVNGPTLDHLLSQEQPIGAEQLFSILAQTSVALDYAHQKGIVHRDIKPANIMIAEDGTAKITDFGIAKITKSEQFTMTGTIVGTPHYMSPEQVQGQAVDGRSDQFSLAVIAYEVLTGEKPFTGEHLTTVVYKIVAEEPASAHRLNPTLAPPIEAVLRRGLAKKPDARYRTCQEFVNALEKACAGVKGWKTMVRGGNLSMPTLADQSHHGPVLPPSRRPRARAEATATAEAPKRGGVSFLTVFLAILVAAGLVALLAWQGLPWLETNQAAQNAAPAAPAPASAPVAQNPPPQAPEMARPSPMELPAAGTGTEPADRQAEAPAPPQAKAPAAPEEPEETPAPPEPKRRAPVRPAAPVVVATNPPGAVATLDGAATCTTPCSIDASPGRHALVVSLAGYQSEHREIQATGTAQELPLITLRAPGGTLMLSTLPPGATVQIDGRKLTQVTPAQIPLKPGKYTVLVEKDGKRASKSIEIQNGVINYQRLSLE